VSSPGPFGMIVLAGGRAARLGGADKPGLVVGGRTLLTAVLAAGAGAGARPVIVVGPPPRPVGLAGNGPAAPGDGGPPGGPGSGSPGDPRVVQEEPPGAGPVPALRRGLAELAALHADAGDAGDAAWVAVCAADLPFLRAAHLRALLAASAGQDGAVLTDDGGRPQWLAGCWRAAALRRAAAGYRGASLHGLLSPLRPVGVRIEPGPGEPPPWLDCDTEADLRRARGWDARGGRPASGPAPGGSGA
jgi:molybdenum cofactor guanylyltransferase